MEVLKLFDTLSREKIEIKDRDIGLYTCGPTVYDYAHIGNFRTYVFEDLLKRTMQFLGYEVLHVMNITDIDDKTIKGALKKGITLSEYTTPYRDAFFEDIKTLNIIPADYYPEATKYIKEMIDIIQNLLDKEIAYRGEDESIYFSIKSFSPYGKLSHLKLDELREGASKRVSSDEYSKEDVSDFVLWKAYDEKRDGKIFWESPFGKGRPGWHIECSAMALKLIGKTVDIHCGGVDNIFPHHENEIAQSESYTGEEFVRCFAHSKHLLVDGKKMSKSLGNFYTLRDLIKRGYDPAAIRYALMHVHYRIELNFTFDGLEAAKKSIERIFEVIRRLKGVDRNKRGGFVKGYVDKALTGFVSAISDDLNISASLAFLFDFIRDVNALIDRGDIEKGEAGDALEFLYKIDEVLGILPTSFEEEIPGDIKELVLKREKARKKRDWKEADSIRKMILEKGYIVEDSKSGAVLKKR